MKIYVYSKMAIKLQKLYDNKLAIFTRDCNVKNGRLDCGLLLSQDVPTAVCVRNVKADVGLR